MNSYEKLQQKLDLFPLGYPKSAETMRILELMFSEEEALLASVLPLPPLAMTAARAARKARADKNEIAERLRDLASRALIAEIKIGGVALYSLFGAVPGFFEMQFMMGQEMTDARREMGLLWRDAATGEFGREHTTFPTSGMRVIPIRKAIDTTQRIFSFEETEKVIRASGTVGLTDCACRKASGKCDAPLDVCMLFGVTADYLAGRGLARIVSRREAMAAFESAANAGLVASSSNSLPPVQLICNCCSCCCNSLRSVIEHNRTDMPIRSNFRATTIEKADCKLCKACVKACPVEALSVENERIAVDEHLCIGCGVCVVKCNKKALALTRKTSTFPPLTALHLLSAMNEERGKTGRIMRSMVKDIF